MTITPTDRVPTSQGSAIGIDTSTLDLPPEIAGGPPRSTFVSVDTEGIGYTMAEASGEGEATTDKVGLPGLVEQIVVCVACFVLFHGLPADWFLTSAERGLLDGNRNLVLAQLALMGLGIARVIGSFDWILRVVRLDAALFGLAATVFASTFWSVDPGSTFRQAIIFIATTLFAAYLVLRFSLAEILQMWAIVFVASALLNFYFIFGQAVYAVDAHGRWSGIFPQKNALGRMALLALPALLAAARGAPRFRWPFYATAAAFAALLVGSESRTMWLGTVGSLCLAAVYVMFRGRRTLRGVAYLGLLIGVGVTIAIATINLRFFTDLVDKDITFTGRIPLWQALWPVATAEPLLGYGYRAAFDGFFSPVHEVWVATNWEPGHAHNELLNLWLQIGLVGVAFYVVMFLRALARGVRTVAALPGAIGLWPLTFLTTALLTSITEAGMTVTLAGWMMFVVAALSASYHGNEHAPPGG